MLAILAALALTSPFAAFEGQWDCSGKMARSGKPISSMIDMATDPVSGIFIVRHDDRPPMSYHSLETWTLDPLDRSVQAAVTDLQSGLRVFRSPLPTEGQFVFSRSAQGLVIEEFRYSLKSSEALQVDWSISRSGAALALGDSLSCARVRQGHRS